SILCEILTGEPAFTGRSAGEIQRKAARGDLADAVLRLDGQRAAGDGQQSQLLDPELVTHCKSCLAPEREDRPRNAGVVAESINAYLSGVQKRLREAEIAHAAESARAEEAQARVVVERSRRRRTIALAALLLATVTVGGMTYTYVQNQQIEL